MKKWGVYLRAPDQFLAIIENRSKLVRKASSLLDVRFGTLTGMNAFYCPSPRNPGYSLFRDVDEHYRIPLIGTIKDLDGFVALREQCQKELFVCDDSKSKLRGAGTRAYIAWAEKQKKNDVPWPKSGEMGNRDPWYSTRDPVRGDVIFQMFIGGRHYAIANPDHFAITNNLLAGTVREKKHSKTVWAVTNSSWFALCCELYGRINLGEGALKIEKTDLDEIPLPDFSLFDRDDLTELNSAFNLMSKRDALPIREEMSQADRRRIDAVIGKVFGLSDKDQEAIRSSVIQLAAERDLVANLRRAQTTERVRRDVSEVTDEILADFNPGGFRRFPEDFDRPKGAVYSLSVPRSGLRVIAAPRSKGQADIFDGAASYKILADDGFEAVVPDFETVEFIHYAQNGNAREVQIPTAAAAKHIMVAAYRKYLASVTSGVEKAVRERVLDGRRVRSVVEQIMSNSGLERGSVPILKKNRLSGLRVMLIELPQESLGYVQRVPKIDNRRW